MNHDYKYLSELYFTVESGGELHLHPHALPGYDLITVLEGEIQIQVDKQSQILQAGQSALIFPYQIRAAEGAHCRYHRCNFSDRIPISFTAQKQMVIPTDFRFTLSPPIMELLLSARAEDPYYARKGLVYLICSAFNQGREYAPRSKGGDLTTKLLIYVDQNFKDPMLEQRLSEQFDYDRSYLLRLFGRTTGIQFKKYVHLRRLEHARYLLECSEFNILRCGEESGFSCARSFNRIFKEHFGCTPKAHRTLYQK